MRNPRVTYFDFAGSRGEEVRLALTLAGVEFEDNRIARAAFAEMKPDLPFPHLPILEVEGQGTFAQTNAILRLIGRLHGLYPDDPYEAARHDAVMAAVEDLRHRISPTIRMTDPEQRKAARQALVQGFLPLWARGVERYIGAGPFVGGDEPGVADIKLFIVCRWIGGGVLDDIPADCLGGFVRLQHLVESVGRLPEVARRYEPAT